MLCVTITGGQGQGKTSLAAAIQGFIERELPDLAVVAVEGGTAESRMLTDGQPAEGTVQAGGFRGGGLVTGPVIIQTSASNMVCTLGLVQLEAALAGLSKEPVPTLDLARPEF